VFEKHCGICHQIKGQGAEVGPALDGVGLRGVDRLLEDILIPHRNVDRNYRSTRLLLEDGRILEGLVLREQDGVLVIADSEGKERRVAPSDINQRRLSKMSPMPANVTETITEDAFLDLLAYLLSCRDAPDSR
jgi:putative heme-binding domain-containing protein